jgi:hypothetical protein
MFVEKRWIKKPKASKTVHVKWLVLRCEVAKSTGILINEKSGRC